MDASVVIPCYNRSGIVGEAIRSALAQTLPPREVIVVDDGSTDGSADVAESFGPPVKVIRTPNRGPSSARNTGIAEARGDWIAFLDSDDVWLPEKLALQRDAAKAYPDAALIFCDTAVYEGPAATMASRFALGGIYGSEVARQGPFLEFDRSLFTKMLTQSRVITSAVLVRRELADAGFPVGLEPAEDWALWLDLALRHRFSAVDQVLVKMFRIGDNISLQTGRLVRFHLAALERLLLDPILTREEQRRVTEAVQQSRAEALYHVLVEGEPTEARRLLQAIPPRRLGSGRWTRYWLASRMPPSLLRQIARWRGVETILCRTYKI